MKTATKLLILLFTFASVAWVAPARASLLSDARLDSIIRIDRDSCAVQIDFPDSGLQIPILSCIQVDDSILALLSSLLDLDLFAQTKVLIASASMEGLLDIEADIQIDDSVCDLLRPGRVIRLLGDGLSLEDLLTLPGDFGDLTAFVLDLNVNDHFLVHLDDKVLNLSNSEGDTGSVGGGNDSGNTEGDDPASPSDGDDSGVIPGTLPGTEGLQGANAGCSLSSKPLGGNAAFFYWAAFLMVNMMCGIRILVTAFKTK